MGYVERAFTAIERKDFVLESEINLSDVDTALPIGFG
jgi:hypothetical protein